MRQSTTTISGHVGVHHAEAAVFWILAGIIVVIGGGDVLALLAVAFAIVTTLWWLYREVEHRLERSDAGMAAATHVRPELTGRRDPKRTSAHVSWRGSRAA
jgi:predicted outer membrane lipoprotein